MLRVFTAFSGYDSQCLALNELKREHVACIHVRPNGHKITGITSFMYDLVGWSEIDKYAIQAHNALFPQWADRNYGDISKIDWSSVPDFDLFTYSSPCQDFSQAGKQRGGEKGSGTRSSLLWECERAIEAKRPKYLLFENVAAVVSKKFIGMFNEWCKTLENMGYTNFYQILNAKTHGYPTPVPQNRKRVFMVSILDCQDPYVFPEAQELTTRLADILEDEVDEKYYLKDARIESLLASTERERERERTDLHLSQRPEQTSQAPLRRADAAERRITLLGWSRDKKGKIVNRHPVQVANSITVAKRDNTQNYVLENE